MSWNSVTYPVRPTARLRHRIGRHPWTASLRVYPELFAVLVLAGVLNLWNLSVNGWANTYYAAAVRSMSTSWHDFVYASMDKSGLMTIDKPPLAYWVQALSVRIFGWHPLSILVPEALMGVGAVALVYDTTRRVFGRVAGAVAGLALAITPITVAVARHNNPDELLLLSCVAAVWCAVRALQTGRTKWLVLSGVCVGLGFETKMGVALLVVPGIAAAWMWSRWGATWRARLSALRQLLSGGAAMVAVAGAWPLFVTLTPAADRPWISGTSDNSIWSLVFGYNGLGRVAGQTGGPAGGAGGPGGGRGFGGGGGFGGGSLFGGATGPFRLLQSALGDQAGWLLGIAVAAGLTLLVLTRLRRRDPRTGWLLAIGGAFLASAVVFSYSRGIFHPYYVSFLAPFAAALVGAGAGQMLPRSLGGVAEGRSARVIAPLAIGAGAVTELVILGELNGEMSWAKPLIIGSAACAVILALELAGRLRGVLVAVGLAVLLAAPAAWAAQTLGHATSGTFPAGGPVSASLGGAGGRGPGGGAPGAPNGPGTPQPGSGFAPPTSRRGLATGGRGGGFATGGPGGFGGDIATLAAAVRYATQHGGGVMGVSSQSSAAAAIVTSNSNVAGLGGFSGRESSVGVTWLAQEVAAGRLRWVIVNNTQGAVLPGDTRRGSQAAMDVVAKTCRKVTPRTGGTTVTMYDCLGRAAAILEAVKG